MLTSTALPLFSSPVVDSSYIHPPFREGPGSYPTPSSTSFRLCEIGTVQWAQNVGAGDLHNRCFELLASSLFNQTMAVERGRSHELVASMMGAVSSLVLDSLVPSALPSLLSLMLEIEQQSSNNRHLEMTPFRWRLLASSLSSLIKVIQWCLHEFPRRSLYSFEGNHGFRSNSKHQSLGQNT